MAHALKIAHFFNTSSLCFCVIRDTHNKNPLKKFNCWGSLWHVAEHNTAAHSAPFPVAMGKKHQKGKSRKRMGWDENILVNKMRKKPTKAWCKKQSITISWPISSQSSSNGNPQETPPSSFIYDHDVIWYLPLVSLGQLSQLCTLPASYLLPTYLVGREGETEKALTLCTHCLAITKPLVC